MIATTSNLVGVLGPSSDEATATVPSLNRAKIVTVGNTGEAAFDHSSFQYFWRNTPPDDANGTAMGLAAYRAGYRRVALVFGSDTAAQGLVPTAKSAFAKLGGKIVSNQSLDPQETSYRTEIVKMLAAKPQAILTEMDPQASATFFSELKQLHGLIPVIGSAVAEEAPWIKAVGGAVGMSQVHRYITGVRAHGPTKGAAWKVWNKSLLASAKNVPKPRQWSYDPYSMAAYDATNMMALAMIAAKNTKPSVYNSFILDVTSAGAGKVEVGTFAAGKKALLAGKRIEYIGPTGPMAFNRWHNSTGAFELDVIATNGKLIPTKVFTAAQLAALTG
jgi:ABC-type branched-subunit amino acid transport system substrate-binding protein